MKLNEYTPKDPLKGKFVKLKGHDDLHYVTYTAGANGWHLAHGLGKSSSYLILDSEIESVSEKTELALSKIFTKAYTYLYSSGEFYLLRLFEGDFYLSVRSLGNAWHQLEATLAFLYQLPKVDTTPNDDVESTYSISVIAESDEPIEHDTLVGLFDFVTDSKNRVPKSYQKVSDLAGELSEADFASDQISILHLDIDKFKSVNSN